MGDIIMALVICPEYGSTAITTGKRGFSIVAGFVGSQKL